MFVLNKWITSRVLHDVSVVLHLWHATLYVRFSDNCVNFAEVQKYSFLRCRVLNRNVNDDGELSSRVPHYRFGAQRVLSQRVGVSCRKAQLNHAYSFYAETTFMLSSL